MSKILSFVFLFFMISSCVAQVKLAVQPFGNGVVRQDPKPDSLGNYAVGDTVTLTTEPSDLWNFLEFKGDIVSTNPTVQVIMNSNKRISAFFVKGNFLFARDESASAANFFLLVKELIEQRRQLFNRGKKERIDGGSRPQDDIEVEFKPISAADSLKINSNITRLLNLIQVKTDTIKAVIVK